MMHEKPPPDPFHRSLLFTVAWYLIEAALLYAFFLAGSLSGALLAIWASLRHGIGVFVVLGASAGVLTAVAVNHNSRLWLQRLRLRRLRTKGAEAEAEVTGLDHVTAHGPRGGAVTRYTVQVRWADPATGAIREGRRRYRFPGYGSRRFEAACAPGARVTVFYPPSRPHRFLADLPFAPVTSDVVP